MNYIINFKPLIINNVNEEKISEIEYKIVNNISITKEEIKYLLNYIIYMTRYKINPKLDNYENKCDLSQSIIYYYFKQLNCNMKLCMTQNVITNNVIGHSFLITTLLVDNKKENYLIDPTYIQFFTKEKCNNNRYFINPNHPHNILLTPDPGYFIKQEDIPHIKSLINQGYEKLTEDIARIYGDSFYNTKVGEIDRKIKTIPGKIYINAFIKGKENISKTIIELEKNNLIIEPLYINKKRIK